MNQNSWHPRAFCKCGWSKEAPFADLFHVHVECCPLCGTPKSELQVKIQRFVPIPATWWNPFTWGQFFLEDISEYREPTESKKQ